MENYQILGRIGEGAHGVVLKAKHIQVCKHERMQIKQGVALKLLSSQTGELVALKKVPLRKLEDGIPNSALRLEPHDKTSSRDCAYALLSSSYEYSCKLGHSMY